MLRIHLLKIFNIKTPQALAAHTLIARPLILKTQTKVACFQFTTFEMLQQGYFKLDGLGALICVILMGKNNIAITEKWKSKT